MIRRPRLLFWACFVLLPWARMALTNASHPLRLVAPAARKTAARADLVIVSDFAAPRTSTSSRTNCAMRSTTVFLAFNTTGASHTMARDEMVWKIDSVAFDLAQSWGIEVLSYNRNYNVVFFFSSEKEIRPNSWMEKWFSWLELNPSHGWTNVNSLYLWILVVDALIWSILVNSVTENLVPICCLKLNCCRSPQSSWGIFKPWSFPDKLPNGKMVLFPSN